MSEMTDNAPVPTVWGTFQARDARAMIDFLVAVGFEATAVYGDGDLVDHAQLDWPEGGGVMFGSQKTEGYVREPGTAGFYVVTDDPHGVYERVRAAGGEVTREMEEADYGSTGFTMRDPEGNLWSFGTYRGEPRKG